jgi:hypothetical protein
MFNVQRAIFQLYSGREHVNLETGCNKIRDDFDHVVDFGLFWRICAVKGKEILIFLPIWTRKYVHIYYTYLVCACFFFYCSIIKIIHNPKIWLTTFLQVYCISTTASFTCPGLRASGLVWRLVNVNCDTKVWQSTNKSFWLVIIFIVLNISILYAVFYCDLFSY